MTAGVTSRAPREVATEVIPFNRTILPPSVADEEEATNEAAKDAAPSVSHATTFDPRMTFVLTSFSQ